MKVILLEEHSKLIEDIATKFGFGHYDIDIESGSSKGDNYLGTIAKITVKNGEKNLNLILKIAPSSEQFRNNTNLRQMFLTEIYMYESVFDALNKFEIDNNQLKGFTGHAKFFGKCDIEGKEIIALENLMESGYRLWNKKMPMDSKHMAIIMREYGRFHAASFAIRHKNPPLFLKLVSQQLASPVSKLTLEAIESLVRNAATAYHKAIEATASLQIVLNKFIDESGDFWISMIEEKDLMVIRHGDCWCNNFMFKYDDPSDKMNPTQVCLIDFQLSRLGPATTDLGYFFLTNASTEIFEDHEKYLKIYHDSLSESLRTMSLDPEEIYPYSTFERQWKKYAKFGLYLAPLIFRITSIDSDEVPDLDNKAENFNFFDTLTNAGNEEAESRANARLRLAFQFMVDNDLV